MTDLAWKNVPACQAEPYLILQVGEKFFAFSEGAAFGLIKIGEADTLEGAQEMCQAHAAGQGWVVG